MRVAVWPADLGGCGHYRLIWPTQALQAQGADIELRLPEQGSGLNGMFATIDGIERLVALQDRLDADVVVIQRPLAAYRADVIPLLQAQGVRVVVEIDDDFTSIHQRNTSWLSTHPRHNPGTNRANLARACQQADLVTVTTPALARRYGGHGRVTVIPNHIPARHLTIRPDPHEGVMVGWTGSIDTHPTDLQITRGAVARAITDTGATFTVVGTGKGVQQALDLPVPPLACGWVPLDDYPVAMAQLDIGIVPLDDIAFNHAKSWLKGLEMAALGVPFVASPTEDYVRLHARGAGLLAAKPKHWAAQLRRLISSPDERAELAAAGRAVAEGLTVEGNADRWWDAWASCLKQRSTAA